MSYVAAFHNGDGVIVQGAGAAGAPLSATVSSISGSILTLSANASTSVTDAQVNGANSFVTTQVGLTFPNGGNPYFNTDNSSPVANGGPATLTAVNGVPTQNLYLNTLGSGTGILFQPNGVSTALFAENAFRPVNNNTTEDGESGKAWTQTATSKLILANSIALASAGACNIATVLTTYPINDLMSVAPGVTATGGGSGVAPVTCINDGSSYLWVVGGGSGSSGAFTSFIAGSNVTLTGSGCTAGTCTSGDVTIASTGGGSGVSSFTGDSALLSNSASTGSVTATLANTGLGYGVWGNTGSSTGAPGYHAMSSYPTAAFPTLNQNTTGSAAKWTTARNLAGNSVDGSANVAFANKFIVQGTSDSGLSGPQFLGALSTGIIKNTTTTGVLSIAASADVYGLWSGSCSSSTYLRGDGACATPSGSSGLSGMTAGQVPIAATASTVTSSEALAGAGAAIVTGPASSTSGDAVVYTGASGQTADAGFAPAPAVANDTLETSSFTAACNQPPYDVSNAGAQTITAPAVPATGNCIITIKNKGAGTWTFTGSSNVYDLESATPGTLVSSATITTNQSRGITADGTNFWMSASAPTSVLTGITAGAKWRNRRSQHGYSDPRL